MEEFDFKKLSKKIQTLQQKTTQKIGAPLIRHTHIYHQARERFELSIIEYCVIATIRSYEGGKDSRENYGWVFASKETVARCLAVSKRTVERSINVGLNTNLLEKHPATKYLRTTEKWIREVDYWKESSKN